MLKERTNRWARLKLLFVVPVMGGALYAFAQPEVKEDLGLNTVREVLQSKPEKIRISSSLLMMKWRHIIIVLLRMRS